MMDGLLHVVLNTSILWQCAAVCGRVCVLFSNCWCVCLWSWQHCSGVCCLTCCVVEFIAQLMVIYCSFVLMAFGDVYSQKVCSIAGFIEGLGGVFK